MRCENSIWSYTSSQEDSCRAQIAAYCGDDVVSLSQPVGSCSARLGKVHGCFVLVKNSSTWIFTCLLCTQKRSQASTAGHPDVHNFKRLTTHTEKIKTTKHVQNFMPEAQNRRETVLHTETQNERTPSPLQLATDPCRLHPPVQNDHAHSWCVWVGTQSFQSNSLRKCSIEYGK